MRLLGENGWACPLTGLSRRKHPLSTGRKGAGLGRGSRISPPDHQQRGVGVRAGRCSVDMCTKAWAMRRGGGEEAGDGELEEREGWFVGCIDHGISYVLYIQSW